MCEREIAIMKARGFIVVLFFLLAGCDESGTGGGQISPLTVTSLMPSNNSKVDSSKILSCEFNWTLNVLEFFPNEYFVRFVFEGHTAGDFNYPDSLIFTDMYGIKNVQGSGSLQFPLSKIWHDPKIEHPLDVRIELIKKINPSEILLIDHSSIIHYKE